MRRTVSPFLTVRSEGVKRILSLISMVMVRLALAATPGLPMAVSPPSSWPWPPAWLPLAKAAPDAASASMAKS